MPAQTGWHLDRAAFDAMLAGAAQRQGATLLLNTRAGDAQRAGSEWRLTLSTGETLTARFLVDATGGAVLARRGGARFVEADKLVGIAGFFACGQGNPSTLIEAFEHGWWYTAGLPHGRRIVACMTDADLVQRLGLHDLEQWRTQLSTMPHVAATVGVGQPEGALAVRSASSRRLEPAAGPDWLAVGDSASRFDPLSSQGILKALRSGIFASYAIGDLLVRQNDAGLERYRRYVARRIPELRRDADEVLPRGAAVAGERVLGSAACQRQVSAGPKKNAKKKLTHFHACVQMNTCHFNSTLDPSATWSKDLSLLATEFFRVEFITIG